MTMKENSTFFNTKKNTKAIRKPSQMDQRVQEGKQDLQQCSRTPPEEAYINIAEMTAIKIAMKEIGFEMGYIYRFAEFNASHREQRKSPNIKPDIQHTSRTPQPG